MTLKPPRNTKTAHWIVQIENATVRSLYYESGTLIQIVP